MEKGQSFGSADELQERRKKKGALPLAVFLSFNDRDVNPQCPNACNPYHRCGWYCLDKIPSWSKLLDGERSEGSSSGSEKMSERKGVNPSCPNASNPFHKCADYCFEKIMEKPGYNLTAGKNKGVLTTEVESRVNPNCKYASNPYHKCDKICFGNSPVGDRHKDFMKPNEQKLDRTSDRAVNPDCKYAANPYHVCSDYCLQKAPERVQTGQAINLKNLKDRKKIVDNTERKEVNPQCKYASNPYHKCSEYCFQNVAQRDVADGAPITDKNRVRQKERKVDHLMKEKKSLDSDSMEALNISHNYTDSPNEISKDAGTKESESGILLIWLVLFVRIRSFMIMLSHIIATVVIKEENEASMIELLDSQPLRIDASDLFKEWAKYCSLKAVEDNEAKTEKTDQR